MGLRIAPVTFRQACAFIAEHHRHHRPPRGMKFAVSVMDGADLVGVATVGRPVARRLDDGGTVEVTRTCTSGVRNANSMLYGAAWRAARALGYQRLITYSQAGESGSSMRAAGLRPVAVLPARPGWDGPSRSRDSHGTDGVERIRWEIHGGVPSSDRHATGENEPDHAQTGESLASQLVSLLQLAPQVPSASRSLGRVAVCRTVTTEESLVRAPIWKERIVSSPSESDDTRDVLALTAALCGLVDAVRELSARQPRDEQALLTADELGQLFGISPRTLKDQANAGVFPHRRFGKHYRFSRADVAEITRAAGRMANPVHARTWAA